MCTTKLCVPPDPMPGECQQDSDCIVTGCSSHICASDNVFSTCEYLPEYACYREPTTGCACVNNRCNWRQTNELQMCLQQSGGTQ